MTRGDDESVQRTWARQAVKDVGATGNSTRLKVREHQDLTRLGHKMKWAKRKGQPAYRGVCSKCAGVCWVIDFGATCYIGYLYDMRKKIMSGPRRCTNGR
jgi:hypothetical protein